MSAYGVSKVGVRMMTTIQQTIMDQDKSRTFINSVSMEEKTFMLCYCLKSWRSENHTPHYYWLNQSK